MISARMLLSAAGFAAALVAGGPATAAGPQDRPQPRVPAPPRPDVNVLVFVEPGIPKDRMPEKAHGYLARKGASNGQREGADDPGPPQGETGDGTGGRGNGSVNANANANANPAAAADRD